MRYLLTNAKVVLPHRVMDGTVVVEDGKIFAIEQGEATFSSFTGAPRSVKF